MRLVAAVLAIAALAATASAQVVPGAPTDPVQADAWALKQFFDYLGTPASLDHWSNGTDAKPCSGKKWSGVSCSKGRVTELDLRGKGLTGTLAPGLAAAGALKKLNLSGNALAGDLPTAWGSAGSFESLTSVSLAGNKLSGDLPALWAARGALPSLYLLDLAGNNLTGTLPEAWGAPGVFPRLSVLGLRNNSLSGGLPAQWALNGSLPSLEVLVLDGNRLDGELPGEWGDGASSGLGRLKLLSAASNQLSGALPASWGAPGALPALQVLNLANNSLSGALPESWTSRGAFRAARGGGAGVVLAPGNAGLNGTVPAGSPLRVLKSLGGGRVERCGELPGCGAPPPALGKGGEIPAGASGPQTLTATLVAKGEGAGSAAWSDGAKAALADAVTKAVGKDAAGPATVTAVADLAASVAHPDVEIASTIASSPSPPTRRRLLAADPLAGSQARIAVNTPDVEAAKRAVKAVRGAVKDGSLLKALQAAGLSGVSSLGLDGEGVVDSSIDGGSVKNAGAGKKGLSKGAIAGIVIGSLLGAAALAVAGWVLYCRGVFDRCLEKARARCAACREKCFLRRFRGAGADAAAKAEAGTSAVASPKAAAGGARASAQEEKMEVPYTEYRKQRLEGAASGKKGRG